VGAPAVTLQSNKLDILKAGGSSNARVNLIPDIGNGDFDIQADWEIIQDPAVDFWYTHMSAWDQNSYMGNLGTFLFMARGYWAGLGHQYRTWVYDNGVFNWFNPIATAHTSGKFRITRVGTTWTTYYHDGVSWVLHYQHTPQVTPLGLIQPVEFRITWGSGASGVKEVRYDNFCTEVSSYTTSTTTTTTTTT
jgi:hypothetical protein